MGKETINVMVEGGDAKPGAQLGGALGPLGINMGKVVDEINKKTSAFKGMRVPVKIVVDTKSKDFDISVGSPPVSELIKKEVGTEKGSGIPHLDFVGNISVEQLVKIARMKIENMNSYELKKAVKEVSGSCKGMGVLCEGMDAREFNKKLDSGEYDSVLSSESLEVSDEKKKLLKQQLEKKKGQATEELQDLMAKKEKKAAKKLKKKSKDEGEEPAKSEEKKEAPKKEKPAEKKKE